MSSTTSSQSSVDTHDGGDLLSPFKYIVKSVVSGFRRVQDFIVGGMDRFFYNHGKRVASHPFAYIAFCLFVTGLCGIGLLNFREENNVIKLWIPEDSSQRVNTDWLWENFPNERRFASMIFTAENILQPEVIQTIYKVRKSVEELVTPDGTTWSDLCVQVQVVKPPKLKDIYFNSEDQAKAQSLKQKRNAEKSGIRTINVEDKIDDLDQPLFPDSEILMVLQNTEQNTSNDKGQISEKTIDNRALQSSLNLYPDPYCDMVSRMPMACLEWSILELWGHEGVYDEHTDAEIAALTRESILDKINNMNKSGIFMQDKNFSDFLGNKIYNEEGRIIGAKATIIQWFGKLNTSEALIHPVRDRDEPIDQKTLDFEGEMLNVLLNKTGYPAGLESYPNVQRSFGDVAISSILGDISYLAAGFAIVFIYIFVMLGKISWVENRVYLSMAGLISVVMGIIVAYGFCSAIGLFFSTMHNVLPFLLLGIGIDDMFVIVQSWETLTEKERTEKPLIERFGIVMTHSGVAITITSITDVVAFALGGTTILPALRSFCFFASVGIITIYWFVCTFFVAIMYLDQVRLESNRDGLCPCFTHKSNKGNFFTNKSISRYIFDLYGKLLMKTPSKIFVVFLTLATTGVGIWGNLLLEQKFVMAWYLPSDSYLSKWFVTNEKYFPFGGERVTIWCSGLDYENELEQINQLALKLANQTDIIDNVDSWTTQYLEFIKLPSYQMPPWDGDFQQLSNDTYFSHKMTQFIFSPLGAKYRGQIKFEYEPWCGNSAPNILMSDMTFTHKVFGGPHEHIPAMNRVKRIISEANLTGKVFPLSQGYAGWETDEVIAYELYRNLGLAILCIFFTTIFLLGDLICSLLVLIMVFLSLIDVAGFMHFWGLTIDTVSCVNLIIAIGLCVDYSAHMAHRFLVERNGSREDRVQMTILNMGPAVMNGGLSTFITFILLANSQSHVFITFFKIFFLVVVFGLFHGLTVLPVILSWIGPPPNIEQKTDESISSSTTDLSSEDNQTQITDVCKSSASHFNVTFVSEEHLSIKVPEKL